MEYPHSKPKPPRGWSYPLNRTAIDAALEAVEASTVGRISFMPVQRSDVVLRALNTGEASRWWFAAGEVWLYIHAVPSPERKDTERALLEHGLPLLRGWLEDLERAAPTWRATNHSFELTCADGALRASSD